jgi:hypothetical protein
MGVAEVAPLYITIIVAYLYMNNHRNSCHRCHPHMARKHRHGPGWSAVARESSENRSLRSFRIGSSTVPAASPSPGCDSRCAGRAGRANLPHARRDKARLVEGRHHRRGRAGIIPPALRPDPEQRLVASHRVARFDVNGHSGSWRYTSQLAENGPPRIGSLEPATAACGSMRFALNQFPEFFIRIRVWKGRIGDFVAEEAAQRLPAIGDVEHQ